MSLTFYLVFTKATDIYIPEIVQKYVPALNELNTMTDTVKKKLDSLKMNQF